MVAENKGWPFPGGWSFCIKNKLKSEILTKNLVSLKDGMGLRMKSFNIIGFHWKIRFLGGHKKPIYKGKWAKKVGAWTVCIFKEGLSKKDGEGVFEGGWYPNTHNVESGRWKILHYKFQCSKFRYSKSSVTTF